jgi:periplasmic copper chaperone A
VRPIAGAHVVVDPSGSPIEGENTLMTTSSARTRARLIAGAALGTALVIAGPAAAFAHIHVTPSNSVAESTTTLTFDFSHGCDDSPTTALMIDIPEGVTNVVPVAAGGWSIERAIADNGTVTQVTYRAATPVESGLKGEVAMDVRFGADLADTNVAFPVTQECVTGSTAWTEIAADGEEEPESPAPVVAVGAVADDTEGHGHDHDATDEHAADVEDTASAETETSASSAADSTAVWLGAGGLALGAAALVVALLALRRHRT